MSVPPVNHSDQTRASTYALPSCSDSFRLTQLLRRDLQSLVARAFISGEKLNIMPSKRYGLFKQFKRAPGSRSLVRDKILVPVLFGIYANPTPNCFRRSFYSFCSNLASDLAIACSRLYDTVLRKVYKFITDFTTQASLPHQVRRVSTSSAMPRKSTSELCDAASISHDALSNHNS